jgi:hypothetical protein
LQLAASRGGSRDLVLDSATPLSIPGTTVNAGQVTAPATYGDRQFVGWQWKGAAAPAGPTFSWDSGRDGTGTLTGIFIKRAPGPSGFAPNYSQSESLHWDAFPLRVFFVASDAMTPARIGTIRSGMDRWVQATDGLVSYTVVTEASQANVTVEFGTLPAQKLGFTQWMFDPTTRVVHSAAIQLSDLLTEPGSDGATLAANACHEFGHVLGIMNHSTDPGDIMFAVANVADVTVTGSDLDTLLNLYDPAVVGSRAVRPASASVETASVP